MHLERCFTPCSHGPWCLGAYFRFVPFLVDSSLDVSVFSASPTSGTSILTLGLQIVVIPIARWARPEVKIRCCLSRRHWHHRYPELRSSRVAATPSSSSLPRAPQSAVDQKSSTRIDNRSDPRVPVTWSARGYRIVAGSSSRDRIEPQGGVIEESRRPRWITRTRSTRGTSSVR